MSQNDTALGRRLAVLVVEDELLVALDIEAILKEVGHQVFGSAASVLEAFLLLETGRPDVALLDFNLSGETGAPVATRLVELGGAVPVGHCGRSKNLVADRCIQCHPYNRKAHRLRLSAEMPERDGQSGIDCAF